MISSVSNGRVRAVAQLTARASRRRESGLFVVEGPRMCREIPDELLQEVYISASYLDKHPEEEAYWIGERSAETVTDEVMRVMCDTQHPQGIVALSRMLNWDRSELLRGTPLLLILESLQDPGNLGTIIRAGEGAGVTGIVMNEETADYYNPKVIRSTMGAVFRMPVFRVPDLQREAAELRQNGIALYAAHLRGTENYENVSYCGACGFMIGNEAAGLTDALSAQADRLIKIPMAGAVESLNAAVAAAVLTFEAARQRRGSVR